MSASVIERLRASDEPSIRWRVRVGVLGEDPRSAAIRKLREQIRSSPRARRLIDGVIEGRSYVYKKWQGAHWALMSLAELGYPEEAPELQPLVDHELKTWLGPAYYREYDPAAVTKAPGTSIIGVKRVNGRYRRCGSQQGGALLAVVRLGLVGDDGERLAERLRHWQWPDGGWNCQVRPEARSSSVYETLLPLRGLAAYAGKHQDRAAAKAARCAADVLLERRLIFRRTDGRLTKRDWARLHYPLYWRYDVLGALKGLTEAGLVDDERCHDALDLLESKQLPDGGWAAEARYYSFGADSGGPGELVSWGGADPARMNEWVTADALTVLKAAGRL